MPLDHFSGFAMSKKDPKDYTVVKIGPSGHLTYSNGLTLNEAIQHRDICPSGQALIVRTASMIGVKNGV